MMQRLRACWRRFTYRLGYSRQCLQVGYRVDAMTAWLPGRFIFSMTSAGRVSGARHDGVVRR